MCLKCIYLQAAAQTQCCTSVFGSGEFAQCRTNEQQILSQQLQLDCSVLQSEDVSVNVANMLHMRFISDSLEMGLVVPDSPESLPYMRCQCHSSWSVLIRTWKLLQH